MTSIFECCDSCDSLLTPAEIASEADSRKHWGQHLCFDCQGECQADQISRRTPAGGEA